MASFNNGIISKLCSGKPLDNEQSVALMTDHKFVRSAFTFDVWILILCTLDISIKFSDVPINWLDILMMFRLILGKPRKRFCRPVFPINECKKEEAKVNPWQSQKR